MGNDNDLLTYEDLANRMGVAEQTAKNKVRSGDWDLPRVRLGYRTVRFKEEDVERFVDENREW